MGIQDYTYRIKAQSGDTTIHDEKGVSGDMSGGTQTLVDMGSGDYAWQIASGRASVAVPSKTFDPNTTGSGVTIAVRLAITSYDASSFAFLAGWATDAGPAKGLCLGQNGTNVVRSRWIDTAADTLSMLTVNNAVRTYVLRATSPASGLEKVHAWVSGVTGSGDTADYISSGQNYTSTDLDTAFLSSSGGTVRVSDFVIWPEELTDAQCHALAETGIRATLDTDTNAPIVSSATVTSITSSGATIGASTDEANGTAYVVVSTSSTTPTAAQIIAGQTHTGSAAPYAGSVAITATGIFSKAATGLSPSTAYYGHIVHRDAANNNSNTITTAQFTTSAGGDVTPPTISGITVTAITSSGAAVTTTTDEGNGTGYVVISTSVTAPTAAQIIAGQIHTGAAATFAGNVAITAVGTYSVSPTGLASYTSYYAHTVHRDAANNNSNVLTSAQFTTLDGTAPTLTGSITASAITQTSYTLTWPAGSDNVAVTSYEYSLNGGTSYTSAGNSLTVNITGRTASTTDAVRVRAKDAAGNASSPLSLNVTLLDYGVDLQTSAVTYTVKNNTGTILSSTSFKLSFYRQDTDAFVVNKTVVTNGSGLLGIVRDPAISNGVAYDIKITNTTNNHKGIFVATGATV